MEDEELGNIFFGKWYNLAIDHNISWFVVNKLCDPLDKLIRDIALVKKKKRTKPCILNNFPVLRSQRIQNKWKVWNWKPSKSIFRSFDRIIVLVLLNSKEWKQYKKKRRKSWTLNRSKQHSEIRLKCKLPHELESLQASSSESLVQYTGQHRKFTTQYQWTWKYSKIIIMIS